MPREIHGLSLHAIEDSQLADRLASLLEHALLPPKKPAARYPVIMSRSAVHSVAVAQADLTLVSVSGPEPIECRLKHRSAASKADDTTKPEGNQAGGVFTIGRRATHWLVLDRPEVSRDHAEFRCVETAGGMRWMLVDLGSRHQTRLNGQTLRPGEATPVQAGDIIEISPWTMRLVARDIHGATLFGSTTDHSASAGLSERLVHTIDDELGGQRAMRTITAASDDLAQERLRLLLKCAEVIVAAGDEHSLAKAVIDAAMRGTGFPNAALLRPLMPDGTVSIIADSTPAGSTLQVSRSLIRQATSLGQPVQLSSGAMVVPAGHSIVDLKIQEAMCVPLMLEGAAAGFLYLDTRRDVPSKSGSTRVSADAGAFAAGLARLAAMALMNLLRRDLEKRFGRMEGEIAAAASAQRLILPPEELTIGQVTVCGTCRAGRVVSGDFFDVMPLDDGRVAIALGDVAGKGMQASVLMTTTQGFLRGVLMRHGDLQQAVTDLNSYLHPRCDGGRFITLWLGAIDPKRGTLEYVNGGHGHACLFRLDGSFQRLRDAGGPLVGVLDVLEYRAATVPMRKGERVVLLSDGILEQPREGHHADEFGWERVERILSAKSDGPSQTIAHLFNAVHAHAGGPVLADDATLVLAGW